MLSVEDTGTGMPKSVLEHAFDPFFTTKDVSSGTGLGLSMVFGFVKQSGGHIAVSSVEGLGSTVQLYLPMSDADVSTTCQSDGMSTPGAHGETILSVEDDPDLLVLAASVLEELGYHTVAAENGPQALELLAGSSKLDLLLTDLILPGGLSGDDIAAKARRRYPSRISEFGAKVRELLDSTEAHA